MNREIKFRAWDKFQKRLIYIQGFIKDGNSIRIWYFKGSDDECVLINESFNVSEIIIEQFTGLKDKNGKDIYEGDIVRWANNNREIIDFYNGAFCGNGLPLCITENNETVHTYEHAAIIGNIYENPKLIAAKDGGVKLD